MAGITTKGIDFEAKEILQGFGKPPPEGLIPIGDTGIYLSPNVAEDKPVSPFDCEQWPDSPYCGGVPWTKTPIGFDLDFGFDGCGAWITGTPILGFTKLPQISAAWRRPGECRDQFRRPELPPPPSTGSSTPPTLPNDIPDSAIVYAAFVYDGVVRTQSRLSDGTQEEIVDIYTDEYLGMQIPGIHPINYQIFTVPVISLVTGNFRTSRTRTVTRTRDNAGSSEEFASNSLLVLDLHPRKPNLTQPFTGQTWNFKSASSVGYPIQTINGITKQDDSYMEWLYPRICYGQYGAIKNFFSTWSRQGPGWHYNCRLAEIWIENPVASAPPPDYRKRKCECMQCCGSTQAQDRRRDQENSEMLRLLREIRRNIGNFPIQANIFDANEDKEGAQSQRISLADLAVAIQKIIHEIQKALKCIGIDKLPIYTPSTVIDDESNGLLGDLGDLKNQTFKQKIESIAELLTWKIKNDYEIFGKWQETIEIEDSDPTQKGNQSKKIILPNMARTFRELVLLNSTQIKVLGMLFDTTLKMYIDLANTKISAAICEAILRDVQDYLDYPTVVKKLDVPLGISIPSDGTPNDDREDLERFLRNSIAKAKFDDWTGEGSLTEMLLVLQRMAEGYLGQNFGKI